MPSTAMTRSCLLPRFSVSQVADAVKRLYALDGDIEILNGERDLNFLIRSAQRNYVFKISGQEESRAMLECQNQVFEKLNGKPHHFRTPQTVSSLHGNLIETITDDSGIGHYCRLVDFITGRMLSAVNPQTPELLEDVGRAVGFIDAQLQNFHHVALERPLLWNMTAAVATINGFLPLIADAAGRRLVGRYLSRFEHRVLPLSEQLRVSAIHNDVNDNNIVIGIPPQLSDAWQQSVRAIIDYGDMVYGWTVTDPAVAAAYAMLGKISPLQAAGAVVRGYHQNFPLTEVEISVLFELMCIRLCMSVCISAHQIRLEPGNQYLKVSEQSAWDCLFRLEQIHPRFAGYYFRHQCGLEAVPNRARVGAYLESFESGHDAIVCADLRHGPIMVFDFSVGSPDMAGPSHDFDPHADTTRLFRDLEDMQAACGIGRYAEYRLIYTSDDFRDSSGHVRTLHLGIDIFMPAGSKVLSPLPARVYGVAEHPARLDYGGTLILEHGFADAEGDGVFYTLYGHLSPASLQHHRPGNSVRAGQEIGAIGEIGENGGWVPHVHFQIITDMLGQADTFVGVGNHEYRQVWLGLCPDPNMILGIPGSVLGDTPDPDQLQRRIRQSRDSSLAPSLRLSYRQPLHIVRGDMQYLYDHSGRQFLDAVNNVAHVGHSHPQITAAIQRQAGVLNTNTRYLHQAIQDYCERLLAKLPSPLEVCFLVNSGSEANDLALRLATNFTAKTDMIVLDHAYHGNLSSLIEISPYKHAGPGGRGAPAHVHTAMMPDVFRHGRNRDAAGDVFVDAVERCIDAADRRGGAALLIAESMPGCGGQIVLPDDYLQAVYRRVRDAGGVCIADEVQVGFGRIGSHFWAFQSQHVVPDMVTLGKPIGNGHPLAAVITTREIANAFDNGMEYFNTFGGNPVSCAVGNAVLDVIAKEHLQDNACCVGAQLMQRLDQLKSVYPLIGDVRGQGMFVGIELINHPDTLEPAAAQADYIVERMRQEGILISVDGPLHNVLKIKPPLCFSHDNAGFLVDTLGHVLAEDQAAPAPVGYTGRV